MQIFRPIWYTIPEFSKEIPVCVYHKENESADSRKSQKNEPVRNLHVLARSGMEWDGIKRVILRISADDYYKLYINGIFIAQGPAPSYPEHYYYNTLDITPFLHQGKNIVAVHLYYQGLINRVWNSGDGRFGVAAELIAADGMAELTAGDEMAELTAGDGMAELTAADEPAGAAFPDCGLRWRYQICHAYSGDVIGYDTQFLENFDSRKWDEGWKLPEYEDRDWPYMVQAEWADYRLTEQPVKMLEIYEIKPRQIKEEPIPAEEETSPAKEELPPNKERSPQSKENPSRSSWFVDMGQEITGALVIRAAGKAGDRVIIRCAQECRDGDVRYDMRCNCRYEEIWTLDNGVSTLEPYDYKGFRYARIIPDTGVRIENIKGLVRHYPMDTGLCTVKSSDGNLDRIFAICKNGVRLGTQEGYLDCPTREKGQYLGDAVVTAHSQVWLTGSVEMLRKCIGQFALTRYICPGLMAVAPGSFMQEIADFSLLWLELLLIDYRFTGDKDFLRSHYRTAAGVLGHFRAYAREDGLLVRAGDKWNLVDWPENLRDGYDFELSRPVVAYGCHNVINALYTGAAKNLTEIEEILGLAHSMDWEKLRNSYIKAFYRPKKGLFADSETSSHCALHSNVYAAYYGLEPGEASGGIGDFLVKKGLACGVLVSYFYLKVLARLGRYEDVFRSIVNESEHGWVNMLREGADTCFEAWGKEQKWNTSLCHPWASAPIPVLIEEIAGFVPDPGQARGFGLFPHIPAKLSHFAMSVPFRGKRYAVRKDNGREKIKFYRIKDDMSMEEMHR